MWFLSHNIPKRNKLTEFFLQKNPEYMLNYSLSCSCSYNLSSFWLLLKQQWTIEEISIFSNSGHLEWRAGLSDTILKGNPPKFALIWFSGFRGEDLNVIFYQNTVEFVYNEVQGTLDLISSYFVIGIVRYKRNNVELPPLLKNDVFQKNYFKWCVTVLFALFCYFLTDNNVFTSMILL
jgi:hypothetical protein